ncbi:hypothetical protein O988_03170 [Pseudogymnoascus sp. VKM F-3808]|nr:hypothetical protein O988_03170 [Pseudogymnoascus sp. VKM F-3808]
MSSKRSEHPSVCDDTGIPTLRLIERVVCRHHPQAFCFDGSIARQLEADYQSLSGAHFLIAVSGNQHQTPIGIRAPRLSSHHSHTRELEQIGLYRAVGNRQTFHLRDILHDHNRHDLAFQQVLPRHLSTDLDQYCLPAGYRGLDLQCSNRARLSAGAENVLESWKVAEAAREEEAARPGVEADVMERAANAMRCPGRFMEDEREEQVKEEALREIVRLYEADERLA